MATLANEPARPAFIREHHLAPWLIVATVCFGAFMGQLDASIVTLAFPSLQHQFNTALAAVEWVSLAYLITLVILLVPIGRLSDRFGHKLIYLYGFIIFTVASAACGFAQSILVLVMLRILQAVGAAMLQANSVALVATSFTAQRRRAALGIQAAAQSLGLVLGPVLGGILVASVGWRCIFFLNVPVGIVALMLAWFLLPRTRQRASRMQADSIGLLLLASSVISTLVVLSGVSGLGLTAIQSTTLAILAILLIIILIWWEKHTPTPLIDIDMLKSSGIAYMLLGALCAYMVLFGPLVLFPQVLVANGTSILRAGLLLSTLPAGFGLAAVAAERVLPRHWHDRHRTIAGGLLATGSAGLLAFPAPDGAKMIALGLLGVGLGIYIPANNAGIMASVTRQQAAVTGGMVNIARGLGTSFGVAIVALALDIAARWSRSDAGSILAMSALTLAAIVATWAGSHVGADANRAGLPERPGKAYSEIESL